MFWQFYQRALENLIFQMIPEVLECLQNEEETDDLKRFLVCIVSPSDYIRKQQAVNINKLNCGLHAAAIGEDEEINKEIKDGGVNVVFESAEQ